MDCYFFLPLILTIRFHQLEDVNGFIMLAAGVQWESLGTRLAGSYLLSFTIVNRSTAYI